MASEQLVGIHALSDVAAIVNVETLDCVQQHCCSALLQGYHLEVVVPKLVVR